ncbi:GPW/gp25 family protein [Brevibacillus dissolubilis]|uniref:GPW/gp25 family protein n=1 Tax=Brevibacillus dissolubilis TaxID=1844116 RepID=UPI00111669F3|nr:GPW/gp25 family protein [Brevibacillus dissolubilis]
MGAKFLGVGWKFPIEVDETTGRIRMSEYEEDIEEAIRLILWTGKGERVMRPDFGCGVQQFLFGGTDAQSLYEMQQAIEQAIAKWEPRVYEVEVTAANASDESGKVLISVRYRIRKTNNLFNKVYPFYINEGTRVQS